MVDTWWIVDFFAVVGLLFQSQYFLICWSQAHPSEAVVVKRINNEKNVLIVRLLFHYTPFLSKNSNGIKHTKSNKFTRGCKLSWASRVLLFHLDVSEMLHFFVHTVHHCHHPGQMLVATQSYQCSLYYCKLWRQNFNRESSVLPPKSFVYQKLIGHSLSCDAKEIWKYMNSSEYISPPRHIPPAGQI